MTDTEYIVVDGNNMSADKVAHLLDKGYELVISWVAGNSVHHILSKPINHYK